MPWKQSKSYEELLARLSHIIKTLDNISGMENKEDIAKGIALAAADMDEDMVALILTQNPDGPFGEQLFTSIAEKLPDEKFEKISAKLISPAADKDQKPGQSGIIDYAFENMMKSDQGRLGYKKIINQVNAEKARRKKQNELLDLEIQKIISGDNSPFMDESIMPSLQKYLEKVLISDKAETAQPLISRMTSGLLEKNSEIQDRVFDLFLNLSQFIINKKHNNSIIILVNHWLQWITAQDVLSRQYLQIIAVIKDAARNFIKNLQLSECVPIIETFNKIYYAKIDKPLPVRELAGNMLKEIGTKDMLDILLKEFMSDNEKNRRHVNQILIFFGTISIDTLLDVLQESRDMSERARILQIVSEIEQSPDILVKKIHRGGPWYYLRNLILMLGKAGEEKHLPVLTPFLNHEDFRVQREALNSIYNIGGDKKGGIILSALKSNDERIQINIVDMLGAMQYQEAVPELIKILESKSLFSSKTSDKLKEKICMALGSIGSEEAVSKLTSIAAQKSLLGLKGFPENIKNAANEALIKYRNHLLRIQKEKSIDLETESALEALNGSNDSLPDFTFKNVGRNDETLEESVVNLLFDSIVQYAKAKNFEKAEELRQQLMEIDPMALDEIIKSEEIIEAEKNESPGIEKDHLGIWPELYDTLTQEEADALFYAMEDNQFDTNQVVFEQGKHNDKLWFIRQGSLKLVFTRGERESLLKTINPGDIAGQDTFFSISLCTTSLITLSPAKISYLNKNMLEVWNSEFPALESKLHDYCLSLERIHDILKGKGIERRSQKRINIPGTVMVHLLSSSGTSSVKSFKGGMSDISVGGMSFLIKTQNPKNVSLLLGRKLKLEFYFPVKLWENLNSGVQLSSSISSKPKAAINPTGIVIGVSHQLNNDYSIHIRFDKLLYEVFSEKYDNSV